MVRLASLSIKVEATWIARLSCGAHLFLLPAGDDLKVDVRLDGEVCDSGVELSLA